MKVRMKVAISGTRDGEQWPAAGELIEVPDIEGRDLVAAGLAEDVREETATAAPAGEKAVSRPRRKVEPNA